MFYKILALDGGGLRSIYSAQLLFRLHDQFKILDKVDMIAGVSGGAIIAAGLGCGWSPSQIVDFFAKDGPDIFERTVYPGMMDDLAYMNRSKYGEGRRRFFEQYFGKKTLAEVKRTMVIPSFDARHKSGIWQTVSFSNFPGSPLRDATLVDAVMSSSAAPVYFPVNTTDVEGHVTKYIDGGLWANNPSDTALSEAVRDDHGGADWHKVVVLSIGTTRGKKVLSTPKNNLGWLDWFRADLIDMILDAAAKSAVDYKMRNYLGARYQRLDTILEDPIDLDDISSISRLVGLANEFDIDPVERWLEGFWV
ncbi:patatin-like phospholipase family protein [Oligoflexus tunisiensis]|uniref:patatin-like phospholipase family protein n=1 Tax=Oligoflexus tunisiensis TaxID=708132 RepID=UPI000AD74A9E|nr:patatin-like phospholipase family protein [Oligoflexus tunisiensis]